MTRDPWTGLQLDPPETYEPYPGADCSGCGEWFELTDLDEDDYCAACAKLKPVEEES